MKKLEKREEEAENDQRRENLKLNQNHVSHLSILTKLIHLRIKHLRKKYNMNGDPKRNRKKSQNKLKKKKSRKLKIIFNHLAMMNITKRQNPKGHQMLAVLVVALNQVKISKEIHGVFLQKVGLKNLQLLKNKSLENPHQEKKKLLQRKLQTLKVRHQKF